MPYMDEHRGIVVPSERLSPHGYGLQTEIKGLFSEYGNRITGFRINQSIMWEHLDGSFKMTDFCIDIKNDLAFILTASYVKCISLKTGNQIWKIDIRGLISIACAPNNRYLYAIDKNTAFRYDYEFNLINQVDVPSFKGLNKVLIHESENTVVVTIDSSFSGRSAFLHKFSLELQLDFGISGSNKAHDAAISRDGKYIYYATDTSFTSRIDKINLETREITRIGGGIFLPNVVDQGDYLYSVITNSSGGLYLLKYDLLNNNKIYEKKVFTATVNIDEVFITHDFDKIYISVQNKGTESIGIENKIYICDKETGDLIDGITLNPDKYVNDKYMKLIHTYDTIEGGFIE